MDPSAAAQIQGSTTIVQRGWRESPTKPTTSILEGEMGEGDQVKDP